jgi:predicted DNA-binding transcriptional regulator AlpA
LSEDKDHQPGPTRNDLQLLTVQDVAKALKISVRGVWYWVQTGRLPPPIRFTRATVRWRAADIEKLVPAGKNTDV